MGVAVEIIGEVAVGQLLGAVVANGVGDVGIDHGIDAMLETEEGLAAGPEGLEEIGVEILAHHEAGLGIEVHLLIADDLPVFQVFAVHVEAVSAVLFPQSRFRQHFQVRPKHVVVGVGAVGVDHAGGFLDEAVPGGDDVVDGAVHVGDVVGQKPVGVVAEREAGRVFPGLRGVQVGGEDEALFFPKKLFQISQLLDPAGGVGPFQVGVVVVH